MKQFFRKMLKLAAYSAAALVILLAILVGLFRLFLPRLPEYQDDIENWASNIIGMEVQFSGMNARWGLRGPEIEFYETELAHLDTQTRAIAAELVSVGISASRLLFEQEIVVDRVVIRGTSIEIRQLENGEWWVQGRPVGELPIAESGVRQRLGDVEFVGERIEVRFLQPGHEQPHFFSVPRVVVSADENRIALDANVGLPDDLGQGINLAATQLTNRPAEQRFWDVSVEANGIALQGWSALHPALKGRILSGGGDVDVSFAVHGKNVSHASVRLDLDDVSFAEDRKFDLSGRFELDRSFDGWLVAAEEAQIATEGRTWPESSLRARAEMGAGGEIADFRARASYINLDDSLLLLPWLPEMQRDFLRNLAPRGEIRDLELAVSELGGEVPYFDITVDLEDVGFAASGRRPGISGFSGYINGERPGGRIEVRSRNLIIELPQVFDGPFDLDVVNGMVIWRHKDETTRFNSDNIRMANAIFENRGRGDLTLYRDRPPTIEYDSSFSVTDVSAAYAYLPHKVMKPKLKDWLKKSLVKGSIARGTLHMDGVLDREFFRNKGGNLLIKGSARDVTLKFHPDWPAVERADVEMVLDNTRLYSVKNNSISAGNASVDSEVEIDDLLDPVLRIKALTTGTLATLHQYAMQSRLNELLGGHLERVTVDGEASFQFDLMVPLKRAVDATLDGVLRSNSGSMSIDGFPAPIEDLIGEVTITRDYLESDNLGGRFLGQDVNIALDQSEDPSVFAIATVTGLLTSEAVVEDLHIPLEGLLDGAADYTARVMFPRGGQTPRRPFTIEIDTALEGLALDLPDPVGKPANQAMQLSGELVFMPGGELIESIGQAENGMAWRLSFSQLQGVWDFDRGVLMAGPGEMLPAETRGLHIRGETTTVRLEDWLNLSRSGEKKVGAAERIRSIDVQVDDLFAIGQHLRNHHVRLDRSARDWLVQIEGEDVSGSVFVPYDFGGDRAMVVEMGRMRLPGDEVTPPSASTLDPRKLPPITMTADEFALGDRYFGAVELNIVRTEEGLVAEKLSATDASFGIVGTGGWVVDENDEMGSRTYITATLNSSDVRTTLARLDFVQGISGESMGVVVDMSWSGGPRASFLDVLDGNVQMRLENGALEEVEPGAGRMLGLVSFVALPRRLSLDFRDVFNKGFRYDSIAGNFSFEKGVASTCDMSLEGPAALIGVVGQVDLPNSEYEQGAVVSAKVGNTLPIVGAVVGGPPGAAAMLIFSQIFKKPLQSVGEVYYGISGPWEEPDIESINSDSFVRYGDLAGCLSEAGQE